MLQIINITAARNDFANLIQKIKTTKEPVVVVQDSIPSVVIYPYDEIIKKEEDVFVVEGELDALSSYQAGVKNVVAIKGSALTDEQVALLKRFTENFNLCFRGVGRKFKMSPRGVCDVLFSD